MRQQEIRPGCPPFATAFKISGFPRAPLPVLRHEASTGKTLPIARSPMEHPPAYPSSICCLTTNPSHTGAEQLQRRYTAFRWNVVFFVFANESFALKEDAEAPGRGFAPLFTLAAFSRSACNFCAFRLNPPIFTPLAFGNKSLILKFSHASRSLGQMDRSTTFRIVSRGHVHTRAAPPQSFGTGSPDPRPCLQTDWHTPHPAESRSPRIQG